MSEALKAYDALIRAQEHLQIADEGIHFTTHPVGIVAIATARMAEHDREQAAAGEPSDEQQSPVNEQPLVQTEFTGGYMARNISRTSTTLGSREVDDATIVGNYL